MNNKSYRSRCPGCGLAFSVKIDGKWVLAPQSRMDGSVVVGADGTLSMEDDSVRPVYLYTVDIDDFVVNKLLDRGCLTATTMVTNVQDLITIVARGLRLI